MACVGLSRSGLEFFSGKGSVSVIHWHVLWGAVQRTGEVCSDAVATQTLTSSGSDVALSTLSSFCKALAGKREGVGGSRGEEGVGPEGRSGWVQRGS